MKIHKSFLTFFVSFILISNVVFASGCEVITTKVYWNNSCVLNSDETWYDTFWSPSGWYVCSIGSTKDYGHSISYIWVSQDFPPLPLDHCEDSGKVYWKYMTKNYWPNGGTEGQSCEVRSDVFLAPCTTTFKGKWDANNNVCVLCSSFNKKIQGHLCTDGQTINYYGNVCEKACGANQQCDERPSGGWCYGSYLRKCDSNCQYSETFCSNGCSNGACVGTSPPPSSGGGGCKCFMMAIGPYTLNIDIDKTLFATAVVLFIIEIIVVVTIFKKLNMKRSKKRK